MSKRKRIFLQLLKLTGGSLLVLAVVHGAATLYYGRLYEAELDKIRTRHESVELKDLVPAPVPDERNGALIYQRAFEEIERSDPKEADRKRLIRGGRRALANVQEAEELRDIVERWRPVLDIAERAAAMPECQFKVNWESGSDVTLPHLGQLRAIARVAAISIVAAISGGKEEEAFRLAMLGVRVASATRDQPSFVSVISRGSMLEDVCAAIRVWSEERGWSDRHASELEQVLADTDLNAHFRKAALGERAFLIWGVAAGPLRGDGRLLADPSGEPRPLLHNSFVAYLVRPWVYASAIRYLRRAEEEVRMASVPFSQIERYPGYDVMESPNWLGPYDINYMMLPGASFRERIEAVNARVALTRVTLAIGRYRHAFGRLPTSLDEMQTGLGWDAPEDPFSGKAFVYRPNEGGSYLLYSVGSDGRDDGGTPIEYPRREGDIL